MKKIVDIVFSARATIVLLLVLAVAMGSATFVEEKYDTETAKLLIYNSKWFEFLLVLLVLNFIGSINKYDMLDRKKLAGFVFHFAFVIIIIGAAVTRYTGFNGTMHIRKGESANTIYSSEPYLQVMTESKSKKYTFDMPVKLSLLTKNSFHFRVSTDDRGPIDIDYRDIIKKATDTIIENVAGGKSMLAIVVPGSNGRETIYLTEGEVRQFGKFAIAYNNDERVDAIKITGTAGQLMITSPFEINRTAMPAMTIDTILQNTPKAFKERCLYNTNDGVFVFKKAYSNAKKQLIAGNGESPDALLLDVTLNGKKHEVQVMGGNGYMPNYQDVDLDGYSIKMTYGAKEIELPFSIYLDRFILDRYPGSMSPSSFTSEVTLIDNKNNLNEKHKIFMNNVLDYNGYRFFQTSYDPDENGTLLSVNHDFYGTWISYAGYLLLALGFLFTLLSKHSRYHALRRSIRCIREKRKSAVAVVIIFFGMGYSCYAQTEAQNHVKAEHADKFGHLVVQTMDGRFEPVQTLAYDVMHKISRKDVFDIDGVGKMDAMQVFIDMPLNVEFWKKQKLIYIREKSVADILGIEGKYASFNDFFDDKSNYKLRDFAETSFRKKQAEQNAFDKEIIKVDERANICMMTFNGSMLKIFPAQQGAPNSLWISWDDSLARIPMTGGIKILNDDLQLNVFDDFNIMSLYFQEVNKATRSGDYSRAEKILSYIETIQRQSYIADALPTKKMVNYEIQYNNSKIFVRLRDWYSMLAMILLVLAFIDILSIKKNKVIRVLLNVSIALLAACFLYHTYGMILRWYLTGHAPWSTGYEALLLIAWGGLLAGFCFVRNSKITLAATTLLAFFILMTASHSDYDPQLTNLQPVLKSYWLIIHVATLTISYGFLGLGFVLGLINLVIYLFKNTKNHQRLDSITHELTHINEMNLTIGVCLATVGTFLGGIWANESWGKYWGWDSKETWALVIVVTYTIVLHLRLLSKMKGEYIFNIGSVFGYSSVLMTFFGVNYYLSKGLHSYASGDTPVFPLWAWGAILSIIALAIAAGLRQRSVRKKVAAASIKNENIL